MDKIPDVLKLLFAVVIAIFFEFNIVKNFPVFSGYHIDVAFGVFLAYILTRKVDK